MGADYLKPLCHILQVLSVPSQIAESAGHRKLVADGVDIAAFNHALFDAYISV